MQYKIVSSRAVSKTEFFSYSVTDGVKSPEGSKPKRSKEEREKLRALKKTKKRVVKKEKKQDATDDGDTQSPGMSSSKDNLASIVKTAQEKKTLRPSKDTGKDNDKKVHFQI